jgi:hypothetical protein
MLTGKYKGFNGCTQSGTFAVKEQCYYNVAAPKGAAIEQRTVPMRC